MRLSGSHQGRKAAGVARLGSCHLDGRGVAVAKGRRQLPKVLSQAKARALLVEEGWEQTIGGKHVIKMEKDGHRPITLPYH